VAGKPTFFATPADLRRWFAKNAASTPELLVGFHRKGSGKPSITWPESVDEALCVGWIDGVRRRIDDTSYTIRFTPRRPGSIWSAINIAKVKELTAAGRMKPAGLAAFAARQDDRSAIYSYEQRKSAAFSPDQEKRFRRSGKAWRFFSAQPPGYRRQATFWVVSAKKEETRARRLATLIAVSAAGHRLDASSAGRDPRPRKAGQARGS
jgi:uncharacterized protein YdeI (YjbR/CyaY-like superfamily)